MPDLGNLMNPSPLTLSTSSNFKPISDPNTSTHLSDSKEDEIRVHRRIDSENAFDRNKKCLDDLVKASAETKVEEIRVNGSVGALDRNKKCLDSTEKTVVSGGDVESRRFLPFLVGAPKMVTCLICHKFVNPGEDVLCSVRSCRQIYHLTCAKKEFGLSASNKFKCSHHECFLCKQKLHWRCVRCSMASHDKCAAWPQHVIHLGNLSALAICWRHSSDWRLEKEDVFSRLPLPYVEEEFTVDTAWKDVMENKVEPSVEEEFTVDIAWKDVMENKVEPSPYFHIKRNLYLIKKKREDVGDGTGCTNCRSTCCEDCVCRGQYISCSKACRCSDACKNRPFRKEKKIKVVKTESCGWGVEATESINKGDFIIEYIGEVINDALCEQRLWDMKYKGVQNFYMCEIRKNFTIDATFKGNSSRFLNHSCDHNCVLEKWQVDGEIRVGVFAARSIKVGEPLTYDYRFVQFGPEVKCRCGASNCQGYLGTSKRKIVGVNFYWGSKRKRSECVRLGFTAA